MSVSLSVEEMSSIAHEFKNTVDAFRSAHANYHALLSDVEDILDSQEYCESECKRIDDFQLTIEQWIAKASSGPCENAVRVVHPEDSVSNVGSRSHARSQASLASSRKWMGGSSARYVQSPRLAAAAKRAALSAEAASLRKQQALQEEELRLKQEEAKRQQLHEEARLRLDQRKRELDLETEIAKVKLKSELMLLPSWKLLVSDSCLEYIPRCPLSRGVVSHIHSISHALQGSHMLFNRHSNWNSRTLLNCLNQWI